VTSLRPRAARRMCGRCGAFDRNSYFIFYLFLPSVAYDTERWQKLDRSQNSTKLYCTLFIFFFIYLLYEYAKRFVQPVVQPVVYNQQYNRLCNTDLLELLTTILSQDLLAILDSVSRASLEPRDSVDLEAFREILVKWDRRVDLVVSALLASLVRTRFILHSRT